MRSARGFTLIEIVIFIVIVSIAVLAVTMMFSQSVRHSADPMLRQRALALANAYMEEILRKRWDEKTPLGGGCVETGSGFCNNYCASLDMPNLRVCEYDGNKWVAKNTAPFSAEYDSIDDYNHPDDPWEVDGFSVSASVEQAGSPWSQVDGRDVKKIVVKVVSPAGETVELQAYRVNY